MRCAELFREELGLHNSGMIIIVKVGGGNVLTKFLEHKTAQGVSYRVPAYQ